MKFIAKRFNVNEEQLKKYSSSALWILFEKILRLSLNLVVGIWLARYLGPSQYGVYNYAIAIATVLLPIVNFGLQGILVKELHQAPEEKNTILGSSILFKSIIAVAVVIPVFFLAGFDFFDNSEEGMVIALASISILFHPFLTLETWYEAMVKTKKISIFKGVFFVLGTLLKVVFLLKGASLYSFAILYSVDSFLVAVALVLVYFFDEKKKIQWKMDWSKLKQLTSKSWLLVLSSISAVIYLKIDQVMLGVLVSDTELGYYSAAVKISESWYFVPLMISNALFPAILDAKRKSVTTYRKRLQQLCDYYFLISFALALVVTLLANTIIDVTYGQIYSSSAFILKIHIWAGIFIFLRTVLSKWLIAEEKYKFSLVSQFSGALANVILNFILIPRYGAIGAAIATIISYMVTSVLILAFFKETKVMFNIFVKSFISPIRFLFKL